MADDLWLTVSDNLRTAHLITRAAFNKRMADRLPAWTRRHPL
jgi:hypothetical protein